MRALETVCDLRLYDDRVVVAGDWHGNIGWIRAAMPTIGGAARTVIHVGDFGLFNDQSFFRELDRLAKRAGVERILVTPGNHESWARLVALFDAHPRKAIRLSEVVWVLPRGFRFQIGDRKFVSLGGAPSIDRGYRKEGVDWWPEEMITDGDVARTIEGGWADVMIAHDTVDGSGVAEVERILSRPPLGMTDALAAYLDLGRERLTRTWRAVGPRLLFHGHYHVRGTGNLGGGRQVISLGMDTDRLGNLVILDIVTLQVAGLPVL